MSGPSSFVPGTNSEKDEQSPRDPNNASIDEIVTAIRKDGSSKGTADRDERDDRDKHDENSRFYRRTSPLGREPEEEEEGQHTAAFSYEANAEEDEYDPDDDEDGIGDLLRRKWYLLIAGALVFILLIFLAGTTVFSGGGGSGAEEAENAAGSSDAADGSGLDGGAAEGLAPIPVEEARDTGLVFEERADGADQSSSEEGADEEGAGAEGAEDSAEVTLLAGDMAWRGETDTSEAGEILTFEGPTAAQFRRGFELPQGSVHTGVFAVAEPGEPILHATYHRIDAAGQEKTTGDYFVTADGSGDSSDDGSGEGDGGGLLAEGSYADERTGDGDEVLRTYTERSPDTGEARRYAVTFQAPEGTPVPYLVGWDPAGNQEAGGSEED